MADEKKPAIVLRGGEGSFKPKQGTFVPPKLKRTYRELEPFADLVFANAEIIERLRSSIGLGSEEERVEAIREARKFAQSLSSSINVSEAIRIVGIVTTRLVNEQGGSK